MTEQNESKVDLIVQDIGGVMDEYEASGEEIVAAVIQFACFLIDQDETRTLQAHLVNTIGMYGREQEN